jgi:hypothetical protein
LYIAFATVTTSLSAVYKCLQHILYVSCVIFLLEVAFLISKDASGICFFVKCQMLQCLNSLILPGFWEQWFKYNVNAVIMLKIKCVFQFFDNIKHLSLYDDVA